MRIHRRLLRIAHATTLASACLAVTLAACSDNDRTTFTSVRSVVNLERSELDAQISSLIPSLFPPQLAGNYQSWWVGIKRKVEHNDPRAAQSLADLSSAMRKSTPQITPRPGETQQQSADYLIALMSSYVNGTPVPPPGNPGTDAWQSKAPMPLARYGSAVGVINDILYVAGGYNGSNADASLQAYAPSTNSWSILASMPAGRYRGNGAAVINGELYIAGGWTISPPLPNSSLFIYNPSTNSWRSGASMPTLSGCGSNGVIDGKLYVTTACNGSSGYTDFLHMYDPVSNTWTQLASSPQPHGEPATGVIGGKLYVAGGIGADGSSTAAVHVYDPASNNWTSRAPMIQARLGAASAVINGKLYVFGGWTETQHLASVEVYDPATDTWTTLAPLLTARVFPAAGVIGGTVYVAGGQSPSGAPLSVLESLHP